MLVVNAKRVIIISILFVITVYLVFKANSQVPESMSHTTAAYGAWQSPISAASIFEASDNVSYLAVENNQV